jgi:hypothetical protein
MSKLDLSKPVQTRDGRAVRILCTDAEGDFPIVGLVKNEAGTTSMHATSVYSWKICGQYLWNPHLDDCDLINVPRKAVGYLVVYPGGMIQGRPQSPGTEYLFKTPSLAKTYAGSDGKVVSIEYEVAD